MPFKIHPLPKNIGDSPIQFSSTLAVQKPKLHLEQIKILIVDDIAINRTILQTFIRKFEYLFLSKTFLSISIEHAANGKEAVDKTRAAIKNEKCYDFIFMDINMPILDGFGATKAILAMNPNLTIISHTTESLDYCKTQESRFKGHLDKPCNKEQVFSILIEQSIIASQRLLTNTGMAHIALDKSHFFIPLDSKTKIEFATLQKEKLEKQIASFGTQTLIGNKLTPQDSNSNTPSVLLLSSQAQNVARILPKLDGSPASNTVSSPSTITTPEPSQVLDIDTEATKQKQCCAIL
jgi:CheY-like chemotaxis protein